jgi:RNA polymerase sigma-70 factor (ECF subfamily)
MDEFMPGISALERARAEGLADAEVVERVLAGDAVLFELLMRRHNQRVYRAVLAILRDDAECEDVMQEAYVRAYEHLAQFEGRAQFSTWLTRIAVNEALRRLAARGKIASLELEPDQEEEGAMREIHSDAPTPEADAAS